MHKVRNRLSHSPFFSISSGFFSKSILSRDRYIFFSFTRVFLLGFQKRDCSFAQNSCFKLGQEKADEQNSQNSIKKIAKHKFSVCLNSNDKTNTRQRLRLMPRCLRHSKDKAKTPSLRSVALGFASEGWPWSNRLKFNGSPYNLKKN